MFQDMWFSGTQPRSWVLPGGSSSGSTVFCVRAKDSPQPWHCLSHVTFYRKAHVCFVLTVLSQETLPKARRNLSWHTSVTNSPRTPHPWPWWKLQWSWLYLHFCKDELGKVCGAEGYLAEERIPSELRNKLQKTVLASVGTKRRFCRGSFPPLVWM